MPKEVFPPRLLPKTLQLIPMGKPISSRPLIEGHPAEFLFERHKQRIAVKLTRLDKRLKVGIPRIKALKREPQNFVFSLIQKGKVNIFSGVTAASQFRFFEQSFLHKQVKIDKIRIARCTIY